MHICLVGGIFDKPPEYRERHSISPETVLADGLRQRGFQVTAVGHAAPLPKDDFDLIHAHHFGRAGLRLAAATKAPPFIFTSHDPFAMNGLAVDWRRRLTDRFVLHRAAAVVALCEAERDFLVKRRGLAKQHVWVIPNGINSGIFDRVAEPMEPANDLLFVGQLQAFKGLDYLLSALPAVRARHRRARLRVVYQTELLLDRYQRQAARLGLSDCVEFAGPQSAASLARLYSTAAVVVSPSLGECLSTVVLEAMSCGAAVVATDVGGIREQLDADTGVIVPARDPSALAEAIGSLLNDPRRRRDMGWKARRKARVQFSVGQMIEGHMQLYEQLLNIDARAA
jgi:glycosyltransferase involved in cell wall biosynthesis